MKMEKNVRPKLGCGLGLRPKHYPVIIDEWPEVDWFEAISENYMDTGGRPLAILEKIRHRYPIALHGVSLSIGSADPLNPRYLERLKNLVRRIDPTIVSDHLSWSGVGGDNLHDLLPLPFTEEAINYLVPRIQRVQESLGREILLENVSTYVTYRHSTMPEWEFLTEISKRSGCGILLDLNNIYVNANNHRFDPIDYLRYIPGERIGQFHLAGHTDMGSFLFDTHSRPIIEPVWDLYREALKRWGQIATLIEWDEDIPDFSHLDAERQLAKIIYDDFAGKKPAAIFSETQKSPVKISPEIPVPASLQNLQQWIKTHIQPGVIHAAARDILNPQGGVSGEERLSVYAGGYLARAEEGLADVYEAVQKIIGHEPFHKLGEAYAHAFPSHDYNLSHIGIHLPEFLKNFPETRTLAFLPELARFEWAIAQSFHAFDGPPFSPSELTDIPLEDWEKARLRFQPSVSLFSSPWPVLDIWKAVRAGNFEAGRVNEKMQFVLIGRRGEQVRCEFLDSNQYRLLEALLGGKTLGGACEELAENGAGEDLPVAEWFARWVQEGLITACEISPKKISVVS